MVTHQDCPQTPGGRIRALGFARMGARGRRRGPIPAMCQYQGSPVLCQKVVLLGGQDHLGPVANLKCPHDCGQMHFDCGF